MKPRATLRDSRSGLRHAANPASHVATILVADAVGYTGAMSLDELGTLTALAESRNIIQNVVDAYGGRIFSVKGDSVLAEFRSSNQGVRCACSMQRALAEAADEGCEVLAYRMGLHVGPVYADRGDLLGDTVNIAARLERLAETGGICVSGQLSECVRGCTELAIEHAGPMTLKGIKHPIPVVLCRFSSPAPHPRGQSERLLWS